MAYSVTDPIYQQHLDVVQQSRPELAGKTYAQIDSVLQAEQKAAAAADAQASRDGAAWLASGEKQTREYLAAQAKKEGSTGSKTANEEEKKPLSSSNSNKNTATNTTSNQPPFKHRYPNKQIEKNTDYLEIQVKEYIPVGFNKDDVVKQPTSTEKQKNNEKIKGYIYLPIPQNIQDTNAVGWGEDSLNSIAAFGVGASQDIIQTGSLEAALQAVLASGGKIGDIAVSGEAQNLSSAFFASKAVNILGANTTLEGILSRSGGSILNPNMELLFNGVKLRSFNFEFDLAPRNKDEAETVKQIIRELKINMAPSTTTNGDSKGIFISAPRVFQLTYRTGKDKHAFLNTFKPMALVNMQVNYTGSGTYATYSDATPVHMKLALSFQELNPIYAEDYDDAELGGTIGVGF